MTDLETNPYKNYAPLDERSKLDTLSWYMLALGIMCIVFAGLFLYLREIRYQDYVLNGVALGRYMLIAGAVFYVAGRLLSYYRRYQRRKAGGQG